MKPQNPEHKAPEGLTDKWLLREGWRTAGRPPGPRDKPPPLFLAQCLLPHFSGQPMDTVQVEQLLGKLMPTLGHLDQELLASRPLLASGQVSLADLMALTELMRVRFSCPLALWGSLRARAEPGPSCSVFPALCLRLRPLPRLAPACHAVGLCGGCPGPLARPGGP
ncbi:unnamed protein product [Rangifer tarandus platyrhynchus]|uniref:Uncharacterized protein n=1 Tax=Rangifer tarandus platyrhynchus TaxID=3082113 RepID=A0ABN8Y726_RANTA|nr:unnamed protein product [Rangifer tarandus platyrhynchus]